MPKDREQEDALFRGAKSEIFGIVDRMVRVQAALEAARQIEDRDLVPRPVAGEPTLEEAMRFVLEAIRASGRHGVGTFAGAHNVALKAFRELGVPGAGEYPLWRRSRAEVDAMPNPEQPREGASRTPPISTPTLPSELGRRRRSSGNGIATNGSELHQGEAS